MLTRYPIVGICKRGRKIRLPDPGIRIFAYHPFGGGFKASDHLNDWRVKSCNVARLLHFHHVDTVAIDPEGLNPDTTAYKLERLFSTYLLGTKKRRQLGIRGKLLLIAEPLQPGQVFHSDPVVREILSQVHRVEFYFIPPTMTAIELAYMFQYLPANVSDEAVIGEVREAADEMILALETGDLDQARRMEWWIGTLLHRLEERRRSTQETGLSRKEFMDVCKSMRI